MNKKAKIIMLPTEDITDILLIGEWNKLSYKNIVGLNKLDKDEKYQHLYITTDDEIKEGDWYLSHGKIPIKCSDKVFENPKVLKDENYIHKSGHCKIIATTDKSLFILEKQYFDKKKERRSAILKKAHLPQPSQAFIENYCKEGGIDEVLVEYEHFIKPYDGRYATMLATETTEQGEDLYELKVDSDNTITIQPIVEKTYTGKDLIGNQDGGLDHFLLQSSKFSQEEREIVMDAIYGWIKETL